MLTSERKYTREEPPIKAMSHYPILYNTTLAEYKTSKDEMPCDLQDEMKQDYVMCMHIIPANITYNSQTIGQVVIKPAVKLGYLPLI